MFQFTGIAREETGISEGESFDPVKSAEAAALLMSKYLKQANGDLNEAITAYNAGFGTINKWKKAQVTYRKKTVSTRSRSILIVLAI